MKTQIHASSIPELVEMFWNARANTPMKKALVMAYSINHTVRGTMPRINPMADGSIILKSSALGADYILD